MRNDPLVSLEQLIASNREEYRKVVEQASYWNREKKRLDDQFAALNQSYRLAGGVAFEKDVRAQPIAQMVEEILTQYGKLHVDEITARLAQEPYTRIVDKQSVVGTLVRYIARGEVFERVGKNTFGLIGHDKEGTM